MVELAEGDVNSDMEQYYRLPEQIRTLLAIETVLDGGRGVVQVRAEDIYVHAHSAHWCAAEEC